MSVVVQGARGVVLRIAVVDEVGAPVALDEAEGVEVVATTSRQREVLSHQFATDGSDGLIIATVPDAMWLRVTELVYQVKVTFSATSVHWTRPLRVDVQLPGGSPRVR